MCYNQNSRQQGRKQRDASNIQYDLLIEARGELRTATVLRIFLVKFIQTLNKISANQTAQRWLFGSSPITI